MTLRRSTAFSYEFRQSTVDFSRDYSPQSLSDTEARALLQDCPDGGFAIALREILLRCDRSRWLTIVDAAELSNVSVRSIQRRLAAEDWTFLRLTDQTRAELAKKLLKRGDDSVLQIAEKLGYTEPQNFIRAFRRWSGKTPNQYRREFSGLD